MGKAAIVPFYCVLRGSAVVPRHEPPFDECIHIVWLCSISIDASCCTAHEVVAYEPLSSV